MLSRKELIQRKEDFCQRHAQELRAIGYISSSRDNQGWWKSKAVTSLIKAARLEVGYSEKTVDLDIMNSLFRTYRAQHERAKKLRHNG